MLTLVLPDAATRHDATEKKKAPTVPHALLFTSILLASRGGAVMPIETAIAVHGHVIVHRLPSTIRANPFICATPLPLTSQILPQVETANRPETRNPRALIGSAACAIHSLHSSLELNRKTFDRNIRHPPFYSFDQPHKEHSYIYPRKNSKYIHCFTSRCLRTSCMRHESVP